MLFVKLVSSNFQSKQHQRRQTQAILLTIKLSNALGNEIDLARTRTQINEK